MTIINLSDGNSVLNQFIAEIRDKDVQKNHMRFRRNLERIGEIFAYEISKTLNYSIKDVTTPLGIAQCSVPGDDIVLATILRAGLPLHNGLLNYFDRAQNAFIAAYRKYGKDNKFDIDLEYSTSPSIEGKVLILADTMLATGASVLLAYQKLLDKGTAVKVIGRLRQYSYLPKDGEKKTVRTSIVARHIELKLTDRAAGAQQDSVTIDEEQGEAGELSEPIVLYEY